MRHLLIEAQAGIRHVTHSLKNRGGAGRFPLWHGEGGRSRVPSVDCAGDERRNQQSSAWQPRNV
jgi:hypothetical protein